MSPRTCCRAIRKAARHRRAQHVEHIAVHRVAPARPKVGARQFPRLQSQLPPEGRRRVRSDRSANRGSFADGEEGAKGAEGGEGGVRLYRDNTVTPIASKLPFF